MTPHADDGTPSIRLHDLEPAVATMRADVLAGLRSTPKALPSQYLYDERGARLFEEICKQPEYYLTRTEAEIMRTHMASIAEAIGPGATLVEPGSGDGVKSTLLLAGLERPAAYVPIDISRVQLVGLAGDVVERFPHVEVAPVCADFTDEIELPALAKRALRRVAFLPGSTIGNFEPDAALEVLRDLRDLCGDGGCVLIGLDLAKAAELVEPAYDDAAGVSRAFALNYLERLNRELAADFELDAFDYVAPYDVEHHRIEMSLVSLRDQRVHVDGEPIELTRGERIRTEFSYKYDLAEFREIAARADLAVERVWTDERGLFSVQLLSAV